MKTFTILLAMTVLATSIIVNAAPSIYIYPNTALYIFIVEKFNNDMFYIVQNGQNDQDGQNQGFLFYYFIVIMLTIRNSL